MSFEFEWDTLKTMRPEVYRELRTFVAGLPEDQAEAKSYETYEGDIAKVTSLAGTVKVKGVVTPWVAQCIANLGDRVVALESGAAKQNVEASVNKRVEVHVPGLGLLLMRSVRLLEDACTDDLQRELDKGWRIIAACPQPDQRRPDYILGHAEAEPT